MANNQKASFDEGSLVTIEGPNGMIINHAEVVGESWAIYDGPDDDDNNLIAIMYVVAVSCLDLCLNDQDRMIRSCDSTYISRFPADNVYRMKWEIAFKRQPSSNDYFLYCEEKQGVESEFFIIGRRLSDHKNTNVKSNTSSGQSPLIHNVKSGGFEFI